MSFHPIVRATLVAAALGQTTTKLGFIAAYRSGLMKPATFVQQINTVSAFIPGRLSINVVAGSSLEPTDEELEALRNILAYLVPIALALAGAGGWFLAHRSLAPVVAMADRARHLGGQDLTGRLPVANPNDELGRLAETFNELLGRLESSMTQQRQFMADASHELRTPITTTRTAANVALQQRHRDEEDYRQTLVIIEQDFMAEGAPQSIAAAALAGLGGVDILVNNAGGSRPFKLEASEAQWEEAMTLNFTRQRQLAHALLAQMVARKWGRIINITGKSEPEGVNGAFAAKAAMHAWAKGLSREVGRHGITVNCIPPGRIMSEQIERNYTPEYRQWQAEHEIPMGRYGEPADLANLACFLASPRAGYITGAVIPVDGGLRRYQF